MDLELIDFDQQHAYTYVLDNVLYWCYHKKKQLLEDMRPTLVLMKDMFLSFCPNPHRL